MHLLADNWSDSITNIGLPDGYTRDKILNTNNHAELFIKTFKHTILGMRCNKRVDMLVIIIADILLLFYRIWKRDSVKHTKEHVEVTHAGYCIWSSGSIKEQQAGIQFQVDDFIRYLHLNLRNVFVDQNEQQQDVSL